MLIHRMPRSELIVVRASLQQPHDMGDSHEARTCEASAARTCAGACGSERIGEPSWRRPVGGGARGGCETVLREPVRRRRFGRPTESMSYARTALEIRNTHADMLHFANCN